MRGEIWKIIDGYSLYEVSNMGRVKVRERKIIKITVYHIIDLGFS